MHQMSQKCSSFLAHSIFLKEWSKDKQIHPAEKPDKPDDIFTIIPHSFPHL